ncbi:hypothetical protein POVCU1_025000 [Plasmodium ovale curtisi]|uniref:Uncharacterized protein n=1 Tax=Plasmodium ovale curtisi TaxID=864141 RepID=A0A1A8WM12_PLAOA|nr:hypothetical protein POVCU1_025000 [Plasmodium ovale curtisi]
MGTVTRFMLKHDYKCGISNKSGKIGRNTPMEGGLERRSLMDIHEEDIPAMEEITHWAILTHARTHVRAKVASNPHRTQIIPHVSLHADTSLVRLQINVYVKGKRHLSLLIRLQENGDPLFTLS